EIQLKLAHDLADRVIRGGDAEQNLHATRVFLGEPTAQAIFSRRLATLQRFEQGNRRRKCMGHDPLMQRKTPRGEPLPNEQRGAQQRHETKNGVEYHRPPRLQRLLSVRKNVSMKNLSLSGC